MEGKLELTPAENTAFWWTNRIKYIAREIAKNFERAHMYPLSPNQKKFIKIFYSFSEKDWRDLYLKLTKYIEQDINSYAKKGFSWSRDEFSQGTDVGNHDRLNQELGEILQVPKFPDIRLADNGSKDEVIYSGKQGVCIWYKSCGVSDLSRFVDPTYILTGDEKEVDVYNQLITTLVALKNRDSKFDSVDILTKGFCKTYLSLNDPKDTYMQVLKRFNSAYDKAEALKIIFGKRYKGKFSCSALNFDLAGLDAYKELAEHYADAILSQPDYLSSNQKIN